MIIRVLSLLLAFGLLACSTTDSAIASSSEAIDANVDAAMVRFYDEVPGSRSLVHKASGVLVFPELVKAGIGIGGEYGEGSLRIAGKTVDYYRIISGSIGFQLGAQVKTEIVLFMEPIALKKFRNSDGWEAGIDGSIAIVTLGAGGEIDTNTIKSPIIGYIISQKGLMYNLTFEGAKISRIDR